MYAAFEHRRSVLAAAGCVDSPACHVAACFGGVLKRCLEVIDLRLAGDNDAAMGALSITVCHCAMLCG